LGALASTLLTGSDANLEKFTLPSAWVLQTPTKQQHEQASLPVHGRAAIAEPPVGRLPEK
jgi:hypothetical protein